jgi:hypothetical protein
MPRIQRAGIRTSITACIIAIPYGLVTNESATIDAIASSGMVAMLSGIAWSVLRLRKYHNDQVVVSPLAEALAPILAIPVVQTQKSITLPPSFMTIKTGEIGSIVLPKKFRATPDERNAVEHLIVTRLPVDVDFRWHTKQTPQALGILASPTPPSMVPFLSLVTEMEACKQGDIVIGRDRKGDVFYGSFNLDDPHWGASCASGRGKSTWLQCIAAQILHNDVNASVDAIDPKQTSFEPLIGVPGFSVECDPQRIDRMWAKIMTFKEEMISRLDAQKLDPTLEFPIKMLFIDEVNQFSAQSISHWRSIKEKDDPATPIIWREGVAPILWMGRSTNCHAVFVGQRLDEKSTGGIGLRDSLGFRALAGFREAQWKMLVGTNPVPRSQKIKGRWIYSDGQNEVWVQNMLASTDKLENTKIIRDYAMANRVPELGKIAATKRVS